MNGIHDLGGMHGFGEVEREPGPPRLERWEAAIVAIEAALGRSGIRNLDEFRYAIERMDPQDYLNSSYFEHWLDGETRTLIEKGVATADDLDRRRQHFEEHADATAGSAFAGPRLDAPEPPAFCGYRREVAEAPRFAVGARVMTRNFAPEGHTRLARYARGKPGTVHAWHGAHVYPDANAMGHGEDPRHLYTVRFEARDLWGPDGGEREAVFIDLWEPYLLPAEGE